MAYKKIFIFTALFLCARVNALGLGDIQVSSTLGQPFAATIELHGTNEINEDELLIRLASNKDFERMGITREAVLSQLKFQVRLKQLPAVILVSSEQPIREPSLNFVIDVQSPKAQLLKEYTVFLDPPQ